MTDDVWKRGQGTAPPHVHSGQQGVGEGFVVLLCVFALAGVSDLALVNLGCLRDVTYFTG